MKKVSFLWKWAFLLLSGVILILVAIGLWTFYTLPESDREPVNFPVQEETINGQADLSTTSFNGLVEAAIGGNDVPYQVFIDDAVHLTGELTVLNRQVAYEMTADPQLDDDGNISLAVKDISLADLDLPIRSVLTAFQLTLPDDVPLDVYPKDQRLVIRLDQLSQTVGFTVMGGKVDLSSDEISMKLSLPVDLVIEQINQQRGGN